ncbi:hypothetical protein RvY_15710 [Ramazzottius varieornatus]|uniref:Uncharacterized protein n=1 Tax=Ramazzottius varieornatus TaxID=947166 RepID=A0A1D1VVW7_RAMVA|nr:hypothetical protein RvY_15710 [Ramazzottius varieornatus]
MDSEGLFPKKGNVRIRLYNRSMRYHESLPYSEVSDHYGRASSAFTLICFYQLFQSTIQYSSGDAGVRSGPTNKCEAVYDGVIAVAFQPVVRPRWLVDDVTSALPQPARRSGSRQLID